MDIFSPRASTVENVAMAAREIDPANTRELNRFIRLERELVLGGQGRILYHCFDKNI